eukprot:COSAG04_NODE_3290_length_2968_cov_19.453468_2_plen_239_part_00
MASTGHLTTPLPPSFVQERDHNAPKRLPACTHTQYPQHQSPRPTSRQQAGAAHRFRPVEAGARTWCRTSYPAPVSLRHLVPEGPRPAARDDHRRGPCNMPQPSSAAVRQKKAVQDAKLLADKMPKLSEREREPAGHTAQRRRNSPSKTQQSHKKHPLLRTGRVAVPQHRGQARCPRQLQQRRHPAPAPVPAPAPAPAPAPEPGQQRWRQRALAMSIMATGCLVSRKAARSNSMMLLKY